MKKNLKSQLLTAVSMLLISVVALVGATYAWFTVSDFATVGTLDVQVKAADGLVLSPATTKPAFNDPTKWFSLVDYEMIDTAQQYAFVEKLSDCSTTDVELGSGQFYDAVLGDTGQPVSYIEMLDTSADEATPGTGEVAREYVKFTLWVKTPAAGTVYLTDKTPDGSYVMAITEEDGTELVFNDTTPANTLATAGALIPSTVRVGFRTLSGAATNNAAKIWEPDATTRVPVELLPGNPATLPTPTGKAVEETVATIADITTDGLGDQNAIDEFTSNKIDLFTMGAADTDGAYIAQIAVYIWVEGADPDTVNAVADSWFRTNLKFGFTAS